MPVDPLLIARAGELIRQGGLVVFPTETVYGLGANALNAAAVARIFEVKGRPPSNPVIVHVDSIEMARGLAADWPPSADLLAEKFWPGPLTLVVRKNARIPDVTTAGLDTAGLRMPAHPVALALIRGAGVPIAAPSANRFTELSPTTADHVLASLGSAVDFILDGGPATVGIESTVLDLTSVPARLLRPGMVTRAQIEDVIGPVDSGALPGAYRSPGLYPRHYSPQTPLYLLDGDRLPPGRGVYLWLVQPAPAAESLQMPADARDYAAVLYDTLHQLDQEGFDWIALERPPAWPEWEAILDRLTRASAAGLH